MKEISKEIKNMRNKKLVAESIKSQYAVREKTKLDKLIELDRRAKNPAEIFAYSFGTVGALTLGAGMSLAMEVIGTSLPFAMPLGIVIGVVGLAMVSANYFLYNRILKGRKAKYGKEILTLSNEILDNE